MLHPAARLLVRWFGGRDEGRRAEPAVGISGVHRRLRAARAPAERLAALEAERAEVDGRLGVTIAALESIRLGLLQLDAAVGDTGTLTEHLEVVRELRRRVDAAQDVERLLDTSGHCDRDSPRATRVDGS